jgi:hypothetical protein
MTILKSFEFIIDKYNAESVHIIVSSFQKPNERL